MSEIINPEQLLKHTGWMKSMARSLVMDEASAHDVVQQTWLASLKSPPRSKEAAGGWLRKVLRNFAYRTRQEEHHRRQREKRSAQPEKTTGTPEALLQRAELQRDVADAVTRLEEPHRSIVLLRFFEELSVAEIARRQEVPVTTVSARLKKALDELRKKLDRRYGNRQTWCLLLLPLLASREVAGAGAVTTASTLPTVVLEGIFMKASIKVAAVLATVVVAGFLLTISGALPDSLLYWVTGDAPLDASFRPIEKEVSVVSPEIEGEAEAEPVPRETIEPEEPVAEETAPTTSVVEAVIVNKRGNPLPGARLREFTREGPRVPVTADARGFVRLELDALNGRGAHLEASLEGYASTIEKVRLEPGLKIPLGSIALDAGGMISGKVLDEQGRGIPGALIHTADMETSIQELENQRHYRSMISAPMVVSDGFGTFALPGFSPGFARLWVRVEGRMPTFTAPIEIQEGQETYGVEIVVPRLPKENTIHGRVIDPEGNPVPHARLDYSIRPTGNGMYLTSNKTAGKDGTFSFLLEEKSLLTLKAEDPKGRYGPATAGDVGGGEQDLVLKLCTRKGIELAVLAEDGATVEFFRFEILSANGELRLQEGEGSFFEPSEDYLVRITAPQHEIRTAGPFRPGEIEDTLAIRLSSLPGLLGTVQAEGSPVDGARVLLHKMIPEGQRVEVSGYRSWCDPRPVDETRTDGEGRFLLTVREADRYVVRVEKRGFAPAEQGPLDLDPQRTQALMEFKLGKGGCISGRVILPDRQDPVGTVVGIHRGDGRPKTMRVGSDGFFRFSKLTPGPWLVKECDEEIYQQSYTYGPAPTSFEEAVDFNCDVREGETTRFDLKLAGPDAFGVSGTLTLDGEGAAAWIAYLCPVDAMYFDNPGTWPTVTLDPHGEFKLTYSEPGVCKLVIKQASLGGEMLYADDVYLGGLETPWSLSVSTGTVVVEGMKPLPEGEDMPPFVYLWEGAATYMSLVMPGKGGMCRLTGVPAGKGKLVVPTMESMNPGDWAVAAEVTVIQGTENRVKAP